MTIILKAEKRAPGKTGSVRRAGKIPAVVYGRKQAPTSVALHAKSFLKALEEAGESAVIELSIQAGESAGLGEDHGVMIKAIEYDPISDAPIHVDLYAVEKGQRVSVAVPIEFEGVSPAVKDLGGLLVKVMHELEVEGEPKNLPHEIILDIAKLVTLDDKLTVADITLPAGVTTENDPEDVVALIDVAKEEEAEAAPMDISQIEMSVEKGKKEEEETPAAE